MVANLEGVNSYEDEQKNDGANVKKKIASVKCAGKTGVELCSVITRKGVNSLVGGGEKDDATRMETVASVVDEGKKENNDETIGSRSREKMTIITRDWRGAKKKYTLNFFLETECNQIARWLGY